MEIEVILEVQTVAVTPSLITIPAPVLPVVNGVNPSIRRKYPEICPGQKDVTEVSVMWPAGTFVVMGGFFRLLNNFGNYQDTVLVRFRDFINIGQVLITTKDGGFFPVSRPIIASAMILWGER
jgi:hypothetical protein